MEIKDPAIIAFAFAIRESAAEEAITELWQGLGDQLGMIAQLRPDIPIAPPNDTAAEFGGQIVAARRQAPHEGIREAIYYRQRDVIGVGVALGLAGPHELEDWTQLASPLTPMLARLPSLGYCFRGNLAVPDAHAFPEIRPILRSMDLDCWRDSSPLTPAGVGFSWRSLDRRTRSVVLLTPSSAGAEVDRRVWGTPRVRLELPRLAHHWLNGALLQQVQDCGSSIQAQLRNARHQTDELQWNRFDLSDLDRVDAEEARNRERELVDAGQQIAKLSILSADLDDVHRSALSVRENLQRLAVISTSPSDSALLLRDDTALAETVVLQLEAELAHAEAAQARASGHLRLTQTRLSLAQGLLSSRQQRLIRVQTALVAALLAGLAALQTFKITFAPEPMIRIPLLAALITLLITAPLLAAQWYEARLPWPTCVCAGLAAGALTWSLASVAVGIVWAWLAGLLATVVTAWVLRTYVRSGRWGRSH